MKPFDLYKFLLLDRDGVINRQRISDYVKSVEEIEYLPNSLEAIALLTKCFKKIFIITNQRGVGRGLMTNLDLNRIHEKINEDSLSFGGKIERIYSCTEIDKDHYNRKPNPGMALQLRADYPEIEFKSCLMCGDSLSDIEFGNRLGMGTVLIGKKYDFDHSVNQVLLSRFNSLFDFAEYINHEMHVHKSN